MNGSMMSGGPLWITAASDYVYVLRGGTVYQMRASDLSLVSQKDLPYMNMNGQSGSRSSSYQSDQSIRSRTDTSGTNRSDSNSNTNNNTNSNGSTSKPEQNNLNGNTDRPQSTQPDTNRSGQPGDMPPH